MKNKKNVRENIMSFLLYTFGKYDNHVENWNSDAELRCWFYNTFSPVREEFFVKSVDNKRQTVGQV